MDARQLLESVAEVYRNLKSFEARATAIQESRQDGFSHNEQAVSFCFLAPDKYRLERGENGLKIVSDGRDVHAYFPGPKRYSKHPVTLPHQSAGAFNPEFPYGSNNTSLLFDRIAERLADAAILRREALAFNGAQVACDMISVTYEPAPHQGIVVSGSPFTFWVHAEKRLVLRMEFEMTVEFPNHGPRTTKHALALTHVTINQPVAPSTFEFTPPSDAEEMPHGTVGGGGGGSLRRGGNPGMEWRNSNNWAGNAFVEKAHYRFHGHEVTIERRWTISEDPTKIEITERIHGPQGPIERAYSIPVA